MGVVSNYYPMRSSWPSLANPPGKWAYPSSRGIVFLVAGLAGIYAMQWILDRGDIHLLEQHLALDPAGLAQWQIWPVLSYALISSQPWPFLFLGGLILMYLAGRELEPILGTRDFLRLIAGATLLAGCVVGLAMALGVPSVAVFGSMSIALGILTGYTTILPDIDLWIFRWSVRAGVVTVATFAAASAAAIMGVFLQDLGYATPLLGAFAGWLQVRELGFGAPTFWQRRAMRIRAEKERIKRMPPAQFISEHIDPILEKIATSGRQSLTRREKALLRQGQEKLATRR